jgi:uncharacterized membrane protein YecN with MAPEG domain
MELPKILMANTVAIKYIILIILLILNLAYIVIIRRRSQRLGGKPPGLHLYRFMGYLRAQSRHQGNESLQHWIFAHYILLAITFIIAVVLLNKY